MKGYDEAAVIDTMLGNLLEANPITQENVREWMKLVRTVQTTLELLDHDVKKTLWLGRIGR